MIEVQSYTDRWMQRYREENDLPDPRMSVHPIERFARTDFSTESKNTAEQSNTQEYAVGEAENHTGFHLCPAVAAAIHARKELHLNQTSFAKYLKISPRTLGDWEQGRRQPSGAAVTLLEWVVDNPERIREMHRKEKAEARIRRLIGE